MTEIVLKNIFKSYDQTEVIHGVDLKVESGKFLVLVGPSGCGKSTLLRIIAGLERITSGEILIEGNEVSNIPASERGLAMVFQSYALYPHMSVYKNMAFSLENLKIDKKTIEEKVNSAAKLLQIEDYLQRKPKALSGGQRQRVAIGRAIVRDPKAFLFDEPLSNLDAELRVTMRKELSALHEKIGGTMIYVTHDQVEAMTLADVNKDNEIILKSESLNIKSSVDVEVNENYTLGIRPEHIYICEKNESDLEVTVDYSEQLGSETYFYCNANDTSQLIVHQTGQYKVAKGDKLFLRLDRSAMHLFGADGKAIKKNKS